MQQRSGFGIWKCGLMALVVGLPALLAEPGQGEETYGVEVLPSRVASPTPVNAPGEAPESRTQSTQERLVLVFDVPITSLTLERERPPPNVNAPPWDPNVPSRIRVHGESDTGPSRIRVHDWEPNAPSRIRVHGERDEGPSRIRIHNGESNAPSRIRVHSWSGGTP